MREIFRCIVTRQKDCQKQIKEVKEILRHLDLNDANYNIKQRFSIFLFLKSEMLRICLIKMKERMRRILRCYK